MLTLYKTKNKSIETWSILTGKDSNGSYYEIYFGKLDGIIQTKRNYVTGKNLGKSNETSPDEQAKKEALSRWKKQIDKGYVENIENETNNILLHYVSHIFIIKYSL